MMTEQEMMCLAVETAKKQTPGRLPKHVTGYGFTLESGSGRNTKDIVYYAGWFWKTAAEKQENVRG